MKKVTILMCVMLAMMLLTSCLNASNQETQGQPSDSNVANTSQAPETSDSGTSSEGKTYKIAVLPKIKGENYFDACRTGVEDAVAELAGKGVTIDLIYDGPPQDTATNQKQVDILEGWIAQSVDAIIVSPRDSVAIAPTLVKAREAGILVVTFDSDAAAETRDMFVNQVTSDGVAYGLLTAIKENLEPKGYGPGKTANLALTSSSKTDANVISWTEGIKKYLATDEFSWLIIQNEEQDISTLSDVDVAALQQEAGTYVGRLGEGEDHLQAIIALNSFAAPALGAAYDSMADKPDVTKVALTGLATPSALKTYILDESNPMSNGVLWNCMDLGYLSLMTTYQLLNGDITADADSITTEKLGTSQINNTEVLLGDALIFNAANVEDYNY